MTHLAGSSARPWLRGCSTLKAVRALAGLLDCCRCYHCGAPPTGLPGPQPVCPASATSKQPALSPKLAGNALLGGGVVGARIPDARGGERPGCVGCPGPPRKGALGASHGSWRVATLRLIAAVVFDISAPGPGACGLAGADLPHQVSKEVVALFESAGAGGRAGVGSAWLSAPGCTAWIGCQVGHRVAHSDSVMSVSAAAPLPNRVQRLQTSIR